MPNNYKSSLERSIAKDLEERNVEFEYETKKYSYVLIRNYKPDFILPNGIHIETKGWHKGFNEALTKLKEVKAQHPELDLRIVWDRLNMKIPRTKMTVEDWSIKNGFKYAEKTIPQEWIDIKWI